MPNGLPEPAMQPLHPDKPEPPIVAGDVWIKKASGKTSVNAPRSERVFRRDWRPC